MKKKQFIWLAKNHTHIASRLEHLLEKGEIRVFKDLVCNVKVRDAFTHPVKLYVNKLNPSENTEELIERLFFTNKTKTTKGADVILHCLTKIVETRGETPLTVKRIQAVVADVCSLIIITRFNVDAPFKPTVEINAKYKTLSDAILKQIKTGAKTVGINHNTGVSNQITYTYYTGFIQRKRKGE